MYVFVSSYTVFICFIWYINLSLFLLIEKKEYSTVASRLRGRSDTIIFRRWPWLVCEQWKKEGSQIVGMLCFVLVLPSLPPHLLRDLKQVTSSLFSSYAFLAATICCCEKNGPCSSFSFYTRLLLICCYLFGRGVVAPATRQPVRDFRRWAAA